MIEQAILAFGTLFSIVNPFSTAFVFNSLATGMSKKQKQQIVTSACITAVCVLLTFLVFGKHLLNFFGVTIYAFRIAGGLYLAKIGFEMLSKHLRRSPEDYKHAGEDLAVMPLAIPFMSGPGAIASVMVLNDKFSILSVALAIVTVIVASWIILRNAHHISRVLDKIGTNVVEKLFGLLVLVIAIQFVLDGIFSFIGTI